MAKKVKTLNEVIVGMLTRSSKAIALKTIYQRVKKARPETTTNSIRSCVCRNMGKKKGMVKRISEGVYTIR